ncbi:MAG TPA: thioredoxin domain-containing protein [Steroidobacteraceae bacterium]|nr:thioredoxin domain-containing protein [Steroidobacteraceae bacterium]
MTAETGGRRRGASAALALVALVAAAVAAGARAEIVATLGRDQITAQDLDARTAAKISAQQQEYDRRAAALRMDFERSLAAYRDRQLNKLVDEHVLALEAKARHTTPEALLAAQKGPPVADAQVRAFYDQRHAEINEPYEAAAPKIREFLEKSSSEDTRRRYLDRLLAEYHAAILLEPRREAVAASGPVRGPTNAPVTIVEFSDFQCPFCGRLEPALVRVLAKYPTQVRLVYRNYPLPELHPQAEKAAEAALCAREQGMFWEMHDLLFAEQQALGGDDLKDKAHRLGLDAEKFAQCLDSGQMRSAVEVDVKDGEALGIQGTPANFINGRFLSGAVEEGELTAIIDDELRRTDRIARP